MSDVIHELEQRGLHAEPSIDLGPTDVIVTVEGGWILLACEFNTPGWEAAFDDREGNQRPLLDGPTDPDAPASEVAEWVLGLIAGGLEEA